MPLLSWTLFVSAALPVLNVFLLCLVGVFLARKGILDSRGRQVLSQIIFWVFTPALTFTKLAASVNLANLKLWWFLPVNMFISIGVGLAIGWVFAFVLKPPRWLRPHIMCAAACGNVGNLPLVLIVGVCSDKRWPFLRALPGAQCQEIGIAYIAFSMWIAGLFQYTVAFNMLKLPKALPEKAPPQASPDRAQSGQLQNRLPPGHIAVEITPMSKQPSWSSGPKTRTPRSQQQQLGPKDSAVELYSRDANAEVCKAADDSESGFAEASSNKEVVQSQGAAESSGESQNVQTRGTSGNTRIGEALARGQGVQRPQEDRSEEDQPLFTGRRLELDSAGPTEGPSSSGRWEDGRWADAEGGTGSQRRKRGWWRARGPGAARRRKKRREIQRWLASIPWGSYLNMPTLAAAAGLSVGCIAAIKGLLFGDSPPLAFLTQALEVLAGGMIPAMMLVLGASLHKGPGSANVQKRVIVGVALCRLVIIPLFGMGLVLGFHRLGVFAAPDPLYMFVLLLMHSTPTAINLQTVATLNQNGEAEMSCLLFWQYVLSLVTMPLWMSAFVIILA